MKRLLILLSVVMLASLAPARAAITAGVSQYTIDPQHTNVLFFVSHVGFSEMVGRVQDVSGTFTFDPAKPDASKVDVSMKPTSIHTSSAKLDEHLQSPDFFNSEKFPEIHFTSTSVKVTGPSEGELTGNLTLLGVTKPVVLKVHFNKADFYPFNGAWAAGFTATTSFNRSEFGMTKYVPMVGDEVRILINTEGTDASRNKPAGEDKRR